MSRETFKNVCEQREVASGGFGREAKPATTRKAKCGWS